MNMRKTKQKKSEIKKRFQHAGTHSLYINKEYLFLCGIFIVGVIIKIIIWNRTPYISRDSAYYLTQIEKWSIDGAKSYFESLKGTFCPPLFFMLVALITKFGVSSLYAALSLNICLGSLIPIITYIIGLKTFKNRSIAICSSLFLLIHPTINHLSLEAQRDVGYIFFLCLFGVFLINTFFSDKISNNVKGSACLACAIFFRIEAFEFFPVAIMLIFLCKLNRQRKRRLSRFLVFSISLCFWAFLLYKLTGMNNKDLNMILDNYYIHLAERSENMNL